jgi:hypothetical protein
MAAVMSMAAAAVMSTAVDLGPNPTANFYYAPLLMSSMGFYHARVLRVVTAVLRYRTGQAFRPYQPGFAGIARHALVAC